MDMKITFNSFGEIERLLRFMLQSRFSFNPYSAFCILKQDPEADIVLTMKEWRSKKMQIKKDAKPIIVPLPTSKKEYLINGKWVSVYDLSVSDREKIIENKLDIVETIEYREYKFFSQNMVTGNIDEIMDFQCEDFEDFSNINSKEYLLEQMMEVLYFVFKVEVERNDNSKIGISSFYSKEKKKLFVNDINAKEVLIAWVDMILKETGTQTENVTEFERELILFFLFIDFNTVNDTKHTNNMEIAYMHNCRFSSFSATIL